MKRNTVRILTLLLAVTVGILMLPVGLFAENTEKIDAVESDIIPVGAPTLACKSAVLMEAATGKILYSQNGNEALPPASVTKIMTLLLIVEAIENGRIGLSDTVTVSAYAASMGGSQVYLKEGEQMMLEDLLKSVVIASANDAAVALAEYLCGSVDGFVERMNQRARELGMKNTTFENVTGLDDTALNHLTSAHDIALMSRALIAHPKILTYSSVWMDSIRDGAFGLTNTNRLVRFYKGCTGLKTGSTSKAGFCVSATAERNGMSLICVIMGADTRDARNAQATALLDWGFSEFGLYRAPAEELNALRVIRGEQDLCKIQTREFCCVLEKSKIEQVERELILEETVSAPVRAGDVVGSVRFRIGEEILGTCEIVSCDNVSQITFFEILAKIFSKMLLI